MKDFQAAVVCIAGLLVLVPASFFGFFMALLVNHGNRWDGALLLVAAPILSLISASIASYRMFRRRTSDLREPTTNIVVKILAFITLSLSFWLLSVFLWFVFFDK
jgi:hypothetical protein